MRAGTRLRLLLRVKKFRAVFGAILVCFGVWTFGMYWHPFDRNPEPYPFRWLGIPLAMTGWMLGKPK